MRPHATAVRSGPETGSRSVARRGSSMIPWPGMAPAASTAERRSGKATRSGDPRHAPGAATRGRRVAIGLLLVALIAAGGRGAAAAAGPDAVSSLASLHAPPGAPADGLDERTPLPLTAMMADHQKRNMRDHLAAVQEIVAALVADDRAAIEAAARRIGYSDSMAQMCQHMGAGAAGFSERALAFHRSADAIGDAARRGDRQAVMTALATTLSACVGCHATYRQQIVDQATWQRLTAQPPDSAPPATP